MLAFTSASGRPSGGNTEGGAYVTRLARIEEAVQALDLETVLSLFISNGRV